MSENPAPAAVAHGMIEKRSGGRHDPLLQAAMASPLDTEVFGEAFFKKLQRTPPF
ncbi:hypothetical protein [Komagataeibacter rhaeticus]|uniref:Uncharacterized protein n=1 Tax=Komagataeibacter rhaeticus TaxID=215221 RepID=A0A858JKB0_9PROT|nr:hypothetical protein [Komagataeibacter rhaeticus]QIP34117.1 hypothetical protein GWK63_00105 [Komagataeibacter rhaeticus]QOC46628.1 hypothetical protein ICJ78_00105 [Komagataeibacter rhaeticus]